MYLITPKFCHREQWLNEEHPVYVSHVSLNVAHVVNSSKDFLFAVIDR